MRFSVEKDWPRGRELERMRLITHNMLMCNKKGVKNGYPLKIEAEETKVIETEYSKEFVQKMLQKIDYGAFWSASGDLALQAQVPSELSEDVYENEDFLKSIHHNLLEVHVQTGKLICPESGREFAIQNGIPNMLLREDEV